MPNEIIAAPQYTNSPVSMPEFKGGTSLSYKEPSTDMLTAYQGKGLDWPEFELFASGGPKDQNNLEKGNIIESVTRLKRDSSGNPTIEYFDGRFYTTTQPQKLSLSVDTKGEVVLNGESLDHQGKSVISGNQSLYKMLDEVKKRPNDPTVDRFVRNFQDMPNVLVRMEKDMKGRSDIERAEMLKYVHSLAPVLEKAWNAVNIEKPLPPEYLELVKDANEKVGSIGPNPWKKADVVALDGGQTLQSIASIGEAPVPLQKKEFEKPRFVGEVVDNLLANPELYPKISLRLEDVFKNGASGSVIPIPRLVGMFALDVLNRRLPNRQGAVFNNGKSILNIQSVIKNEDQKQMVFDRVPLDGPGMVDTIISLPVDPNSKMLATYLVLSPTFVGGEKPDGPRDSVVRAQIVSISEFGVTCSQVKDLDSGRNGSDLSEPPLTIPISGVNHKFNVKGNFGAKQAWSLNVQHSATKDNQPVNTNGKYNVIRSMPNQSSIASPQPI